jgi:predicted transcriptional regulator
VLAFELIPPCIVVVRYILPAVRAQIARELINKYGLRRSEAAEKMGVTPAAVTQYLKGVRGEVASSMVENSTEVIEAVSKIAENLVKDEDPIIEVLGKMCETCRTVRSNGLLCEMHKEMLPALKGRYDCNHPDHLCPSLKSELKDENWQK